LQISCIPTALLDASCRFNYHNHISRTALVQMSKEFTCPKNYKLAFSYTAGIFGGSASAFGEKLLCEAALHRSITVSNKWTLVSSTTNTTVGNGLDEIIPNFSCVP
ncbi:hypothetical protein PMAYCL1PPCAC_10873, partial [Pristionchus mayeri]